jgi:hypothetical protein
VTCIFHRTGNSAQLCQNFGISGGVEPLKPPPQYATAVGKPGEGFCSGTFERQMKEGAGNEAYVINPLTPELIPSAQRCLTRFFTGDFAF